MGESADQTRDEITRLRQEMSQKVAGLRKAAERPVRVARAVAVGTVVVVVVGGVTLVVLRARRRAEARTVRGRARAVAGAVAEPQKAARKAREAAGDAREKLRAELRQQLAKEMADARPLHEKILATAAKSAASAAVPIVMRKLQERMEPAGAGRRNR